MEDKKVKNENKDFIFVEPLNDSAKMKLKRIIAELAAGYYKFLLKHSKVKHPEHKYFCSICGIFKNEGLYLKEWIEFHLLVGINHFYLYNNFSDDDYDTVLAPYIETGIVDLYDWPVEQGQLSAYQDCVEKHKGETQWIAFIDIDEFITPLGNTSFISLLENFKNRPVVKLYWKIFGSSGLKNRDTSEYVVSDFTLAWKKTMNFGKCIFNTDYEFDATLKQNNAFHHHMWAKKGIFKLPPVNILDQVSFGVRDVLGDKKLPVQLNHYIVKSYSEFTVKKARGDVFYKLSSINEEYFRKYDILATEVDLSAQNFLKLKQERGT